MSQRLGFTSADSGQGRASMGSLFSWSHRAANAVPMAAVLAFLVLPGCGETFQNRSRALVESLPIPAGWSTTEGPTAAVPGTKLAAWNDQAGHRLVVFRTLPDPRPKGASSLAAEWAIRHQNQPGNQVIRSGTTTAENAEFALLEVAQKNQGAGLAASDTGDLRRIYIGLQDQKATYWLLFFCPEGQAEELKPIVDQFLKSWTARRES